MSHELDISIVIPLLNEEESLKELSDWIGKVMHDNQFSYEVIFVDDGSKDGSWKIIEELQAQNSNIRGIKFRRNYGKSAGLNVGFAATKKTAKVAGGALKLGFKGAKKGTPFAAQSAAEKVATIAYEQGMRQAEVVVSERLGF